MNIITSVILFAVLMLSCALQACNPTPAAVPNDTHSKSVCEYEHLQNLLFKDAARFSASRANPSLQDAIFSRWSASGSEWDLRELFGFEKNYSDKYRFGHRGDYDFTATSLISILMLFGSNPERLRPETARHIAEVLLVDKGGKPRQTVPGSLGLVEETENHILMTESSRYLANQWLHRHYSPIPQYDNRTNGLEDWLINYLAGIRRLGFHEYNSIPYQGYTIHALLNLEAFADSDRVRSLSRISLDNICRLFALSSLNYRNRPPFRRQLQHAATRDPYSHSITCFMAVWATDNPEKIPSWLKQKLIQGVWGIIAASLPYHPPAQVVHFLNKRGQYAYLARVGRGRAASPEIYSAGPGFLLSAGGIAFAPRVLSKTAARPITLLLDDNAHDFNDCFQIPGKTSAGGKMNNTGVAHRFACGNTPVMIPQQYNPVATLDQWSIFKPLHDHWIWVIISENGTPMERHYALWPPLEIEERASTGTR